MKRARRCEMRRGERAIYGSVKSATSGKAKAKGSGIIWNARAPSRLEGDFQFQLAETVLGAPFRQTMPLSGKAKA